MSPRSLTRSSFPLRHLREPDLHKRLVPKHERHRFAPSFEQHGRLAPELYGKAKLKMRVEWALRVIYQVLDQILTLYVRLIAQCLSIVPAKWPVNLTACQSLPRMRRPRSNRRKVPCSRRAVSLQSFLGSWALCTICTNLHNTRNTPLLSDGLLLRLAVEVIAGRIDRDLTEPSFNFSIVTLDEQLLAAGWHV